MTGILVMQDLLNNDSATVIQIVGSGVCQQHAATDALCTDMTHFVLDYSAFEKLAHPGYGVMNLQMRLGAHPSWLNGLHQACLSGAAMT